MLILVAAKGCPPPHVSLNATGSCRSFVLFWLPGLQGNGLSVARPSRHLPREVGLSFLASSTLS